MIKINAEDFAEGGFSVEDMLEVSAMLEKEGIDAIEMSGGTGGRRKRASISLYVSALSPKRTRRTTGMQHGASNRVCGCRSFLWVEFARQMWPGAL